jgi:hypothetical protein
VGRAMVCSSDGKHRPTNPELISARSQLSHDAGQVAHADGQLMQARQSCAGSLHAR